MEKEELFYYIAKSWSRDTCYPLCKENWNIDNPSLGQCAVTSLVVNDFLGGKIMRCMCGDTSHYYNVVNGEIIDFTVEQFGGKIPEYYNSEEKNRNDLLENKNTAFRYFLLLENVKNKTSEQKSNVKKKIYK